VPDVASRSATRQAAERFVARPGGVIGVGVLLVIVLGAVAAPALAPHDPLVQFAGSEFDPPGGQFPLGTDQLGRDLLSRIVFGARSSLIVGILAVLLGAGVGGASGLAAGYTGGWLDAMVMRLWDAVFAVPAILTGIALAAAFGAGATNAAIAIGIATMPTFARLMRGAVIQERVRDYVEAARALGATDLRIVVRHIVPNSLGPFVVQIALAMGAATLLEAGLSFLGLGTQPPQPAWGDMLAESRLYLRQAPWYAVFPGIALTSLVVSLNFCADALRDALDPRSA